MSETVNVFQGSPQQDEQWLRDPEGPRGRVQAVVRVEGPLERAGLLEALRRVAERHEILRTTFVRRPGIRVPLQAVAGELEPAVEARALDAAPTAEARALHAAPTPERLANVLAAERTKDMDFEHGPLVRALLLSFAPERHLLVITLPSLCADASSVAVLLAELAHQLGADAAPVDDPLQYADFAAWQAELAEAGDEQARAARNRWDELAGASSPQLPFARPGGAREGLEEIEIELPGAPSSAFVQAAWHVLLARLSAEQRVAVPYVSPERRHADLEGAIGAFARPVPVLTAIDETTTFQSVLSQVEAARGAVPELQDYAPPSAHDTFTIGFLDYDGLRAQAGQLTVELERVISTAPDWPLALVCQRGQSAGRAWISFDPARHPHAWVKRLARALRCLIASAAADPAAAVATLGLLDADERIEILEVFGRGPLPAGGARHIPALVTAHAAAASDRVAVHDGERALSYGELEARSNQLAHVLREAGAGPGAPVGLCMDRSGAMIVGLVGILKAGAAYLPLNFEHPAARLHQQLAGARAVALVTQAQLLERLPAIEREVVCLDRDRPKLDAAPSAPPALDTTDDDLAYVIYTSGSTGRPKGVAVTHGNLTNYAAYISALVGADREPLSFGAVTAISTDLGNTSVFGALASGGTLVLVSPERAGDAAALAAQLESTPVDILKITPSHLGALLAGGDAGVLPRRTLVLGGERAPWDLIDRIRALSDCEIVNHYGPTETTVGCCTCTVSNSPGPYAPASVPIGRPIAGATCYVLDSRMSPVPVGVAGTLFVGGAGVARGYVGQPNLTTEAFLSDPFESDGSRLYNTGDVVRWLPDGALEFLGRADEQIKIRGYRVEPAEIEAVLRRDPRISEVAVLTPAAPSGERRLVAYYTASSVVSEDELRARLAEQLPEFMIPSVLVALDTMPRTASGKIDRRGLPDPDTVAAAPSAQYVAPSSPTEEAIASIFAQTLGAARVGRDDDFFELGGHSLLATQVVAQVRSELAVDLPLHALFTSPTVALLADEVVALMGSSDVEETSQLLAELESLSDAEVEELLAEEAGRADSER